MQPWAPRVQHALFTCMAISPSVISVAAPGSEKSRLSHLWMLEGSLGAPAEAANSGGRHYHYMTQPQRRLQKGAQHRTDIPSGAHIPSGLDPGLTPAASIRRSTTMPQRCPSSRCHGRGQYGKVAALAV